MNKEVIIREHYKELAKKAGKASVKARFAGMNKKEIAEYMSQVRKRKKLK